MREEIPAPVLMVAATLLFATMGMFVKFASVDYSTGEIVFYRGVVGTAIVILLTQWRGKMLRTSLPWMHLGRSVAGVAALGLWFYAIAELPLPTAVTLNYMAPIWVVALLIVGPVLLGGRRWMRASPGRLA